ncbi:MAG: hypothetical protein JWN25_2737 [Verrucomicrobiales bacterium]|nr:hypothetical protein [Verrucomicrobiales bacterium]MDB6131078.1 hypothetical protein [Verrucomicrobiales bacterium]
MRIWHGRCQIHLNFALDAKQPSPYGLIPSEEVNSRVVLMKQDKSSNKKKSAPLSTPTASKLEPVEKPQKVASKKKELKIPAILLEGDEPSKAAGSGPGKRYTVPESPGAGLLDDLAELPEAYGTKKLLLTARDPHWLYAHWDLTREQLKDFNKLSAEGHLTLKVYENKLSDHPLQVIPVHPESRNWFIPVSKGGGKYLAELGYIDPKKKWHQISTSGATLTPPDSLSGDTSVRFATIPHDVPFKRLLEMVKTAAKEHKPLLEILEHLKESGHKHLPAVGVVTSQKEWTKQQEEALSKVVTLDQVRRVWIGSLEITELLRRQLNNDISSQAAAQFSVPSSIGLQTSSLSSAFGGESSKPKSFWFNVNAELIIYGATEPDATVTIGGKKIKLRPDGTFSFRFILPDGKFDLPAIATSSDGDDSRVAALKFSRSTHYSGEVGAHPQDPALRVPTVENVS